MLDKLDPSGLEKTGPTGRREAGRSGNPSSEAPNDGEADERPRRSSEGPAGASERIAEFEYKLCQNPTVNKPGIVRLIPCYSFCTVQV